MDGISPGSEVRLSGIKVGSVLSPISIPRPISPRCG
ncbi:hypothetical protein [Hypericibacter adhaerens]|nr:hypothetical protein [Hypericibacter adhaerens]